MSTVSPGRIGLLLLLGGLLVGCRPSGSGDPARPNILLVSIDTLRPDHLSCYGYGRTTSPHLDRLAGESALFENVYAHAPFTLISHMSMFTSLFPETHAVSEEVSLSRGIPLLAEVLEDAGYATAGVYNVDWLDPGYGFDRGFGRWERHFSGGETEKRLEALVPELAAGDDPFFLFVHLMDVHCTPLGKAGVPLYDSPPEYRDRFLPHPDLEPSRHLNRDIYTDRVELTPEERENVVAQYDGGILYADSILGRLLERFRQLDIYRSTLIVVTSDHGESLGDHGTFDGHGLFWENGLRVPLVVKLPRSHPAREGWVGQRFSWRVQSVDIAPTVMEVAGIDPPEGLQGTSLLHPGDRRIFAQRGKLAVMIEGDHKIWLRPAREDRLFDLRRDPREERPLQQEQPELVWRLRKQVRGEIERMRAERQRLVGAGADPRMTLDEEARRRLEELGYLGSPGEEGVDQSPGKGEHSPPVNENDPDGGR